MGVGETITQLISKHRYLALTFKRLIYDDMSYENKRFIALINHYTSDESNFLVNESKNDLILLSKSLQSKEKDFKDLVEFLSKNDNDELSGLALEDKFSCEAQINALREKLIQSITHYENIKSKSQSIDGEDCDYTNGLSLEITAGVGGQESSLFVNELLEIYEGYSEYLGLGFNLVQSEETDLGGLRKAYTHITGDPDILKNFHYESGVHRIQRIPKTEKYGRIHTSTVAVSVIPKNNAVDSDILRQDLIIETCRAQGKGGQHVNTTDSAVRIIHIPTGIVVERQEERSQIVNKERALRALKEKLSSMRNLEQYNKTQDTRKSQRGTLARSEKIRTYNFPQDRITDHRTGQSFHDLKNFFAPKNGAAFHNLVTSLQTYFMRQKFREIISRF